MRNCTCVLRTVLCLCLIVVAGVLPGFTQQIEKGINVSNGDYLGFLEYKPANYATKTSTRYPLIIFLHGIGERGNGTTELQKVSCCGLPRVIKRGHDMSFTWNNKTESFIVLSPQCPKKYGMWPTVFIDELIAYAKKNLRVDPDRIFLTGLSMGGGGSFKYISTAAANPKNLAAVATICAPCTFKEGKYVADAKLPFWGFHAADDAVAVASCTESAVRKINEQNPAVKPLKTIWPTGGHVVWDRVYTDTNYRYDGVLNIYEWFLGQNRTLPANKLPKANAGNTLNITTGAGVANLNASSSYDTDGKIVRYVWKKIQGPDAGIIQQPFGPNATTSVTGLTKAGTYKYQLHVVDDRASFAIDTLTVIVSSGAAIENSAPIARAGTDITITLPVNSVKVDGSKSSDADGTIDSYSWTKNYGPGGSIVSPSASITDIKNLTAGSYSFKLKVTDNKGAISEDQILITVKPEPQAPNEAPVADAGKDVTITLPINTISLDGSGSSDPDGTIKTYQWTKKSGPSASLTSSNTAKTSVNNLTEGTYVFTLRVTDDKGLSQDDDVTVIVKPEPPKVNNAPVAKAGQDITITLPTNRTTLDGSGSTDPENGTLIYEWIKVSGPSQYIITDAAAATTTLSNLSKGTYEFMLTVTDDKGLSHDDLIQIIVNAEAPAPNKAPTAQAGENHVITLPDNTVTLNGSSSSDGDGNISEYKWSLVSGPSTCTIVNSTSVSTRVEDLVAGTYQFELEVTDNDGAKNTDTVEVEVKEAATPPPAPNQVPVAKAGIDIDITLPENVITLDGSASVDDDGTLVNYAWEKIEGPSQHTVISPSYHITRVENLVQGIYVFRLQVKDNDGALAYDTIRVTVHRAPNETPVSRAGTDQEIRLPVNAVELNGSGAFDPDGTIEKYFWEFVTGPQGAVIGNKNSAATTISNLTEGTYKFRLTVTDNDGKPASDVVLIQVLPELIKQIPVSDAGDDMQFTLPNPTIRLNGKDSYDPDGTIESYSWVKAGGPGGVTIVNSGSAEPTVIGVQAGEYTFRLTVTDNDGQQASDVVKIIIHSAPVEENRAPSAEAGAHQTIAYPATTAEVDGSLSADQDGNIVSYQWKQVGGPAPATIGSANTVNTEISKLQSGQYLFELTVTDNRGGVSRDTVNIMVVNTQRYEEQLTIFPNPARSSVNVQLTSDTMGLAKMTIYNASGVYVRTYQKPKTQTQLFENVDISELQAGLYFMEIIVDGKQRQISKFIKQR